MTENQLLRARRTIMLATSTLTLLTAAGCGGDGVLAPGLGSANITATGAVTASGSGLAMFQSVSSGGTTLFQIVIAPATIGNNTWSIQIANYSGRLPTGTYTLTGLSGAQTNPTANFYYTNGSSAQQFNSTSGQLVITTSTASAVAGNFTFSATDPVSGTATVSAHGTFTAQCAPGMTCQ